MSVEFWQNYLGEWNEERKHILSLIPPDSIRKSYLDELVSRAEAEPASISDIEATQSRLGFSLPEDLKSFYEFTNGWKLFGLSDLAICTSDRIGMLPNEPKGYILDIQDYFENQREVFFPVFSRQNALLLSTVSRCGFCVARPISNGVWSYAWTEFGAPGQRFDSFTSVMDSMRWFCLYYLRSHLDH